jgi:hypothetical protein
MSGTGNDTLSSVQTALVNAGVGQKTDSAADWMIYRGFMEDGPSTADRALALYITPGSPPEELWAIDYPGVQIVARGKADDYAAVAQKLQDVFEALHSQEQAISGNFVYFYARQSAPLSMGRDERRRPSLSLNFRAMRNRPA